MFGCDKICSDIIDLIIKGFENQDAVELRIGLFLRPELAADRASVSLRLTLVSNLPCSSIHARAVANSSRQSFTAFEREQVGKAGWSGDVLSDMGQFPFILIVLGLKQNVEFTVDVVAQLRRHYCWLTMGAQKLEVRRALHNFI
jgi:hypothetical protein